MTAYSNWYMPQPMEQKFNSDPRKNFHKRFTKQAEKEKKESQDLFGDWKKLRNIKENYEPEGTTQAILGLA